MATHDDLETTWEEVEEELARRGFALFHAPLDPGSGPSALWPASGSVSEFLDLAQSLSVTLVHAHAARLEPIDVEELAARLEEVAGAGVESVLRDAEGHTGDIRAIEVAFSHGGVSLLWIATAAWYSELDQRAELEAANASIVQQAEASLQEDEWVRRLARSADFGSAKSNDQRLRIAFRMIPELEQLRNALDPRARFTAQRVVRSAWDLYEAEIRPEQERDIARKAHNMLKDGIPKHEVAGRYGMGVNKLNRILGQYGAGS